MNRSWLIFLLILFTLLTVLFTFPLALEMKSALVSQDVYDSYLNTWIFAWQAHQLILDPLTVFTANTYYPLPDSLAFSEIILPEAVVAIPIEYATGNPVLAHNIVLFALFPLDALAMYLWSFHNSHSRGAGVVAGLAFAFATFKIGELRHVQLEAALWMPLTFLYVQKFFARPTSRHVLLASLFFVLNALSSWYYAVFLSLALVLFAVWSLATRDWRIQPAHLKFGGPALVLIILVLVPFIAPYLRVEEMYDFSLQRDIAKFSARPLSYLATVPGNLVYSSIFKDLTAFNVSRGQPLFPGLAAIALALIALVRRAHRSGYFLALAVCSIVLSFGPQLLLGRAGDAVPLPFSTPYTWLQAIPGLKGLGAPARFDILVTLALAMLAGQGALVIASSLARGRIAGWVLVSALVLSEHLSIPIRLTPVLTGAQVPGVYRYLATMPRDEPVVEEPMGAPNLAGSSESADSVYYSSYHWHPLVNGYSGFLPRPQAEVIKQQIDFPSSMALDQLRELGVVWIVVHWEDAPAWWEIENYRTILGSRDDITLVKKFGETWLYRIER